MKITKTTNLNELAHLMGPDASPCEAHFMLEELLAHTIWTDTEDIPEDSWFDLLQKSVEKCQQD